MRSKLSTIVPCAAVGLPSTLTARGPEYVRADKSKRKVQIPGKKGTYDVDDSTDMHETIEWLLNNVPNHNGRASHHGKSYRGWLAAAGLSALAAPRAKCRFASGADHGLVRGRRRAAQRCCTWPTYSSTCRSRLIDLTCRLRRRRRGATTPRPAAATLFSPRGCGRSTFMCQGDRQPTSPPTRRPALI